MSDLVSTLVDHLERRESLDVTADLTATVDGDTVRIESYTDRVFVDLPSFATARRLYDRHGAEVDRLPALLGATDLTLEVSINGTSVAVVGPPGSGGRLERAVGYDGLTVLPGGVLRALLSV